jgi:hypothetical protein
VLKPQFEVQGIGDDDAIEYLLGRGMTRSVAEEAVRTITGGRFSLLIDVASAAANKPIAGIREELDVRTQSELMVLKISPTHVLFRALIAKGRVMSAKAREHLPAVVLAALVKDRIMALHPTAPSRCTRATLRAFCGDKWKT